MKIKVKQDDLLDLIGRTQNIVEKKTTMPILGHVLLEVEGKSLKIYVTDLEVSLIDKIDVKVLEEGKVVVDAKKFYQIIKELDEGIVNLSTNKNGHLEISQGKVCVHIISVSLLEYPVFPITYAKNPFYINPKVLREMIEKTMYSVSADDVRNNANGIYFEQFKDIDGGLFYKMVSTDGHRLSLITRLAKETEKEGKILGNGLANLSNQEASSSSSHHKNQSEKNLLSNGHESYSNGNNIFSGDGKDDIFYTDSDEDVDSQEKDRDLNQESDAHKKLDMNGVIIPRKGLVEIKRLLERCKDDIQMSLEGTQLTLKHGETFLLVRLVEGVFPQYEQFIPSVISKKIKVSRDKMISSLKLASVLTDEKSKTVRLFLTNGKIKITSQNPDLGDVKEEVATDYSGEDLSIGFNVRYLLDVLNSIEEEKVSIGFTHSEAGGIFNPLSDQDYTCVVMPMKL